MVKQLVVVNMAVPMDFSQLSVQISHASMLGILNQGSWVSGWPTTDPDLDNVLEINCDDKPELKTWLKDHFTLVVCKVWGKDQLIKLKMEADNLKLNTAVMEDYGHTTALAIGPADEEKLKDFKRLTLL